jgi:hypothetical protein
MKKSELKALIKEAESGTEIVSRRNRGLNDEKALETELKKNPQDKGLRSLLDLRKFLNKNM